MSGQLDITFGDLKPLMQAEVLALLAEWGISGKREGKYFRGPNPSRGSDKAGSFTVWLTGPAAGSFKEWDAGDAEKGDIVDLAVYAGALKDRAAVFEWACARYGYKSGNVELIEKQKRKAREKAKRAERDAESERDAKRRHAEKLFNAAGFFYPTCLSARYLTQVRGLAIAALPRPLENLRHAQRCYWREGEKEDYFPAMMAAMHLPDGQFTAIHRTYLDPETAGKAPVPKAKKMLGATRAAACRLYPGSGEAPVLVLTEGIEDAAACAIAMPEARCWAVGSLNGLATFEHASDVSLPARVVVMADNDWRHGPAAKGLDRAVRRLSGLGRPVAVARTPIGKDANDFMQRSVS